MSANGSRSIRDIFLINSAIDFSCGTYRGRIV